MKHFIRQATRYRGRAETQPIRDYLSSHTRAGWPSSPADEGDLLFTLAGSLGGQDALEVGFATGSTAAYMLFGMTSGRLTSIDYDQNHFERAGEKLVAALGLASRHRLIERDSIRALPELHESGARFGLVFLDGWKTFDRVWVDTFYCARMLTTRGHVVLDDAQMPAVRKCISILTRYYGFKDVSQGARPGGWRQRVGHVLTTRSIRPPYVALQKTTEIEDTAAGRQFDFWRTF